MANKPKPETIAKRNAEKVESARIIFSVLAWSPEFEKLSERLRDEINKWMKSL